VNGWPDGRGNFQPADDGGDEGSEVDQRFAGEGRADEAVRAGARHRSGACAVLRHSGAAGLLWGGKLAGA